MVVIKNQNRWDFNSFLDTEYKAYIYLYGITWDSLDLVLSGISQDTWNVEGNDRENLFYNKHGG